MAALSPRNIRSTVSVEVNVAGSSRTNFAISPDIPSASRIIVHDLKVMAASSNSVAVSVRIGFAAATLPSLASGGAAGMIASHPGLPAGSGFYGISGIGAAGEELRLTCGAPTDGSIVVTFQYEIVPA